MKPIQQHKDPRITNISFENFTGSIYIYNQKLNEENNYESMLTSPRTNGVDHFVPSHHLSLITQPVLGARSRSRKKTNNLIIDTSTSAKDTIDSMTNSRRSSFNDSPPLILPINRVDNLQYQKKINSNSHHESSDSGLDLSLSTNSSVQLQQYPQQHITIHRPLSALNEDSNPDDGYHDEHQQQTNHSVRLRFPPLTLGRNRSMEDMLNNNNNNNNEQQHRSSSFSDERQQKLSLYREQKMKRSSDGILLDLTDSSREHYQRTNDFIYPTPTQQHRSLNDLTNKNSNKVLSVRNESNNINNLSITQTITRKPNTSTLKPLRKKTKLNIIIEPSIPLTSSRTNIYDEQITQMNGTTSSSSNQTTPRAIQPLIQQQNKSKITPTPLANYSNQEQIRAHVSRSVVERQHPTILPPPRRGLIQQMIPFDASPSKVNNLLLRHRVQQNQPATLFHPNSNNQLSLTRQIKQTLPTLHDDEIYSNIHEEKKRFKPKDDFHEIQYKKQGKMKDINHKYDNSQDLNEQINPQRHFMNSIQKQQIENISTGTPRRQYVQQFNKDDDHQRQRRVNINDQKKNLSHERHGSSQSTSTVNRTIDTNENYKKQQKNTGYIPDTSLQTNRTDGIERENREKHIIHGTKPAGISTRNKIVNNNTNEKNFTRTNESNNQYGLDYSQKNPPINLHTRPSKNNFQTNENSTLTRKPVTHVQTNSNQYENSKYVNDHYPWNKSQTNSTSKPNRIQPILSTNLNSFDPQRERETSRLSSLSKTDSIQQNEKQFKQMKSPTSWSVISEHENDQQHIESYNKTIREQSQISTSPSSPHEELIHEKSSTPSRTYRLIINDQQQEQPSNGRYVIPSNNLPIPSSHESSRHTHSFICTPDFENNNDKQKSHSSDVYVLSDRDNTQNTIDRQHSPSPLVHLSTNKKFYSSPPPPPAKVTISKENDEITSNYDSDDGWSDDSAELLYVDERYATEKRKFNPSSHLPTQQNYYYQIQQQNLLLQ